VNGTTLAVLRVFQMPFQSLLQRWPGRHSVTQMPFPVQFRLLHDYLFCASDASLSSQPTVRPFPSLCRLQKAVVPVGSDELHRLLALPILVAVLAVETLERLTSEAVGTGTFGSQPLDAADLHLASGFGDISLAAVVTHSAAKTYAVCQRPARSAISGAASNLN